MNNNNLPTAWGQQDNDLPAAWSNPELVKKPIPSVQTQSTQPQPMQQQATPSAMPVPISTEPDFVAREPVAVYAERDDEQAGTVVPTTDTMANTISDIAKVGANAFGAITSKVKSATAVAERPAKPQQSSVTVADDDSEKVAQEMTTLYGIESVPMQPPVLHPAQPIPPPAISSFEPAPAPVQSPVEEDNPIRRLNNQSIPAQRKGNPLVVPLVIVVMLLVGVGGFFGWQMLSGDDDVTDSGGTSAGLGSTGENPDMSWEEAYLELVHEWESSYKNTAYGLGYIDDNDIPELYMYSNESPIERERLYTYHEGAVVVLSDSESPSDMDYHFLVCYVERGGLINFNSYDSGSDIRGPRIAKLEDGELVEVVGIVDDWEDLDNFFEEWMSPHDWTDAYGEQTKSYTEIVALLGGEVDNTEPTPNVADESWREAYLGVIHEWEQEYENSNYWLFYIDDNDVPELYTFCGWFNWAKSNLYTYHNGDIILLNQNNGEGDWILSGYTEKEGLTWHSLNSGGEGFRIFEFEKGNYNLIETFSAGRDIMINDEAVSSVEWENRLNEHKHGGISVDYHEFRKHFNYDFGYNYAEIVTLLGGEVEETIPPSTTLSPTTTASETTQSPNNADCGFCEAMVWCEEHQGRPHQPFEYCDGCYSPTTECRCMNNNTCNRCGSNFVNCDCTWCDNCGWSMPHGFCGAWDCSVGCTGCPICT